MWVCVCLNTFLKSSEVWSCFGTYDLNSIESVKWDWRAFLVSEQEPQTCYQRECDADAAKKGCVLEADSKVNSVMPCRVTRVHARFPNGARLLDGSARSTRRPGKRAG